MKTAGPHNATFQALELARTPGARRSYRLLVRTDMAQINGIELPYEIRGDGTPVVLVCGMGVGPRIWRTRHVPALVAAGHTVVTFANRGEASSEADSPVTAEQLADDTAALVDRLGLGPCAFVGASLGAVVVEHLCHRRPDLVRCAALFAGSGRAGAYARMLVAAQHDGCSDIEITAMLAARLTTAQLQDDAVVTAAAAAVRAAIPLWSRPGLRGQAAVFYDRVLNPPDIQQWYGSINAPCLFGALQHDVFFPPANVARAADAVPRGEFVVVPGATHEDFYRVGERVLPVLADFLGRH